MLVFLPARVAFKISDTAGITIIKPIILRALFAYNAYITNIIYIYANWSHLSAFIQFKILATAVRPTPIQLPKFSIFCPLGFGFGKQISSASKSGRRQKTTMPSVILSNHVTYKGFRLHAFEQPQTVSSGRSANISRYDVFKR